jgi:hypothetical protein
VFFLHFLPLPPLRPALSSTDLCDLLAEARRITVLQHVHFIPKQLSRDFSVGREVSRLLAMNANPCWNVNELHARAVLVNGLTPGPPPSNK